MYQSKVEEAVQQAKALQKAMASGKMAQTVRRLFLLFIVLWFKWFIVRVLILYLMVIFAGNSQGKPTRFNAVDGQNLHDKPTARQ